MHLLRWKYPRKPWDVITCDFLNYRHRVKYVPLYGLQHALLLSLLESWQHSSSDLDDIRGEVIQIQIQQNFIAEKCQQYIEQNTI